MAIFVHSFRSCSYNQSLSHQTLFLLSFISVLNTLALETPFIKVLLLREINTCCTPVLVLRIFVACIYKKKKKNNTSELGAEMAVSRRGTLCSIPVLWSGCDVASELRGAISCLRHNVKWSASWRRKRETQARHGGGARLMVLRMCHRRDTVHT